MPLDPYEIAGFIFGVAGVWLTSRQNIWCFPVGLVNVIISLFLFINHKLYSDALQQGVYIFLLSYGWYHWLHGRNNLRIEITRISTPLLIILSLLVVSVGTLMGYFFHSYTDADLPYFDAFATAMSFAAQYLVARKIIENWLLWMVVNIMYIGIYIHKELFLYAVLFTIYLLLAIYGFLSWRKSMINLK